MSISQLPSWVKHTKEDSDYQSNQQKLKKYFGERKL